MVAVQGRFTCKQLAEEFHVIVYRNLKNDNNHFLGKIFLEISKYNMWAETVLQKEKITPLFTILLNVDY